MVPTFFPVVVRSAPQTTFIPTYNALCRLEKVTSIVFRVRASLYCVCFVLDCLVLFVDWN